MLPSVIVVSVLFQLQGSVYEIFTGKRQRVVSTRTQLTTL